jgi:hypothetical protein
MIEFKQKFMEEEEYTEFVEECLVPWLNKYFGNVQYHVDFHPMVCIEGEPRIEVSIDSRKDYERLINDGFLYSDKINGFVEDTSRNYGTYSMSFQIYENKDVTDVKLGDLVNIVSSFGDYDHVGIITAIIERDGEKLFGCSYLSIDHHDKFAREGFNVSEENYGGYHTGFAKKLSKEEAIMLLKKKAEKDYTNSLERIKEIHDHSIQDMEDFVESLGGDKIIVSNEQRLKFNQYLPGLRESLISREIGDKNE